jgi:hypothetical protein
MKIAKPIVFRNSDFTRASIATYYNQEGFVDEAAVDELRIGYDPVTHALRGPIIEGSATNYLTHSNDFSNAAWNKSNSEVTVGMSSPYLNPGGGTTTQYLNVAAFVGRLDRENPLADGEWGTFSIWVHEETPTNILFTMSGCGTGVFDLSAGVVFSGATAHIENAGNGWFRCAISGIKTSAPLTIGTTLAPYRIRLWGAQLEASANVPGQYAPTSYIETTSAPVTRAADIQNVSPPRVAFSSVAEDDAPVWQDDVTYNAGDKVMVLGQVHKVFSSVGTNINKYPPTYSPSEWIDEGATNRWRMFDMNVGAEKQTVSELGSDSVITVVMEVAEAVTALALLNIYGAFADITMTDSLGNIVYSRHVDLLQPPVSSGWWAYFFGVRQRATNIILTDLPNVIPSTIQVTLDGGDTLAAIGKLVIGDAFEIGCTKYGAGLGIVDFSRKDRDPFGNNFILERRFVASADFNVQIDTARVDEIYNFLNSIRATGVLYIGEEVYTSTAVYGFYRDYKITIDDPKFSNLTLQVEGI